MLAEKYEDNAHSRKIIELCEIVNAMKKTDLSEAFIAAAFKTALEYEGVADLFMLWRDENEQAERDEIIADIQELVDDCQVKTIEEMPRIKMNDLEAISKDVRSFKDNLLVIVDKKGGISHLSKLTGIPQPSLSRFFNSNAMPRRTTLLKIAAALDLDSIAITTPWAR